MSAVLSNCNGTNLSGLFKKKIWVDHECMLFKTVVLSSVASKFWQSLRKLIKSLSAILLH